MVDPDALQARLREVRAEFDQQLPLRGEQISACWAHLKRERQSREAQQALYRMVHNLAGAGGTFGHDEISAKARQVADPLRCLMADGNRHPAEAEIQLLEIACGQLVALCRNPARRVPPPETGRLSGRSGPVGRAGKRCPVYLLGEGVALKALATALGDAGREVHLVADAGTLPEMAQGPLVVEMASLRSGRLSRLLRHHPGRPPLAVLSENGDYETRLAAVRAGADLFLVAPIDGATLNQQLRVLEYPEEDPDRVMIVDDDPEQARYAALLLERHDIRTRLLNQPQQLIRQLQLFSPHLILLDLYMPGCSGTELARLLRQYDPRSPLSILFLSVERDRSAQLAALQAGADDFLTKPIVPDQLVAAVRYRLGRVRALRSEGQ